nr:hypothetical protein [Thiobacillaceae bacterium]
FYEATPRLFREAIGWAVNTWLERPSHITGMRERAMKLRFQWEDSARRYVEIYQRAMARRGP